MRVHELASLLRGCVDAGYGESEVAILLNHGSEFSEEEFDLEIDNVDVFSVNDEPFIRLEAYVFNQTLEEILDRFGYEMSERTEA